MYLKQLFKFTLHDMVINIFIMAQQMCGILSVNDTDLCTCVLYTQSVYVSSQKKKKHGSECAHNSASDST